MRIPNKQHQGNLKSQPVHANSFKREEDPSLDQRIRNENEYFMGLDQSNDKNQRLNSALSSNLSRDEVPKGPTGARKEQQQTYDEFQGPNENEYAYGSSG